MMVSPKEIIEALRRNSHHAGESKRKKELVVRIEAEGIAPPDGMVLVPIATLESWQLSLSQGDISPRWEIEAMLAAAPKGVSDEQ